MRIAWPDLLGYDIFISYAHTEASAYAAALEKQLEKADLKCFLDVEEAPAGTELESAITAALEKSRILVLVGTPSVPDRPWIRREIATFESRRVNGTIIPIDVGQSLQDHTAKKSLLSSLQKIVWVAESSGALTAGDPSPDVIGSIQKCVDFRRRKMVWRLVAKAVSLTVIALIAVGLVLAIKERQALQQKNEALVRESTAVKDREQALERAVRSNLDAQLLEPTSTPVNPLDTLCRDHLEKLLDEAIAARYKTAEIEIRRRLSRLPSRAALKAQLARDGARLAVTTFPSGARIAIAYRDRIVIADGSSLKPLYTHRLEPLADQIWLRPNPGVGDVVYAALREKPQKSAKLKYYSIAADGSHPIALELSSYFEFVHGQNVLPALVREFANRQAKTNPPEMQLPPEFRWKEDAQFGRTGQLRSPLVVPPDRKVSLWLVLDRLTVEKEGRGVAKLTFTARPVVETESGEISDIAPPEFQSYFLPMAGITTLLPIEPKYEVAVLDVTHRVAAVRNCLVSFAKSKQPVLKKMPFALEGAASAEFNSDATKLFVLHKNGSVDVWDLVRQLITHRFLSIGNARCVAVRPLEETVMVVQADGRLEIWDLMAFAPNGWAIVRGDVTTHN